MDLGADPAHCGRRESDRRALLPSGFILMTLRQPDAEPPLAGGGLSRILVFRALHFGDFLCSLPALTALRRAASRAHITLVGLPSMRGMQAHYPELIDEWLDFPGAPGIEGGGGDAGTLRNFTARLRYRDFELAIQMHGSGDVSNPLLASFGAQRNGGFHPDLQPAPSPWHLPWREHEHELLRWLRLMNHLGAGAGDNDLCWPTLAEDRLAAQSFRRHLGLRDDDRYVCLHPGAKLRSRRWPTSRFAEVAARLLDQGWKLLITGTAAERVLIDELLAALPATRQADAFNLGGRTTFGLLAGLLADSDGLLCNDTGVSHLAAAVGAPSVVVACGSRVSRWQPLDTIRHRVLWADAPCRPCDHDLCPYEHACAWAIPAAPVIETCQRQFGTRGGPRRG